MSPNADSEVRQPLKGVVHPGSYFQIVERDGIDYQLWLDVILGRIAGAVFRNAMDADTCAKVRENFWNSPALKLKKDGLADHAKAFIGGAIAKPPLEKYFDDVNRLRRDLDDLFAGTDDFYRCMMTELAAALDEQGFSLRLAEQEGRVAGQYKVRSWANTGEFVILPHDDTGVLKAPHLRHFEVAELDRVVGVLLCLENGAGGELQYWNISPDNETRETLGFNSSTANYDSYGYPLESLAEFSKITVFVKPGDLYMFDQTNVHAVGSKADDEENRTTVVWAMGVQEPSTVLAWA